MKKNVSIIFLIFTTVFISCQDEVSNELTLAEEISYINTQNIASEFDRADTVFTNLRSNKFSPFKYIDYITSDGNVDEPDFNTEGYYFTSGEGITNLYCQLKDDYIGYLNQYVWGGLSGNMKTSLFGYETDNAKALFVKNRQNIDIYVYLKDSQTLKSISAYRIGISHSVNVKILKKNIFIIETWDFPGQYHAYIIIDIVTGEYYNFPVKGTSSKDEYEPHFIK